MPEASPESLSRGCCDSDSQPRGLEQQKLRSHRHSLWSGPWPRPGHGQHTSETLGRVLPAASSFWWLRACVIASSVFSARMLCWHLGPTEIIWARVKTLH